VIPEDVTFRAERLALELEFTSAVGFPLVQREAEARGVPKGTRPTILSQPNRWTGAHGFAHWEWWEVVEVEEERGEPRL